MKNIIKKITTWNSKRYNQEYSKKLTESLLTEEIQEFLNSKNETDQLDALCDIIYVAIGAMWKIGLNKEQIEKALLIVCAANDSKEVPSCKEDKEVKVNIDKGIAFQPPEAALEKLLNERHI